MIRHFFIFICLLLSISACTKTTFVRSAPDYTHSLVKARVTLILPPSAEVYQVDAMNKKIRMYDYEERLEDSIADTLIDKMYDKGYNVKLLSKAEIANNKISSHYIDTKDNFEDVVKILYKNGAWKEKEAYSINQKIPSAVDLGKKAGADLLVIVNLYAESKTSGAMARDFTMQVFTAALTGRANTGSDKSEFSTMRIAIIEVATGKVLWTHSVGSSNDMIGTTINSLSDNAKVDKKNLSKLFDTAFEDLPSSK